MNARPITWPTVPKGKDRIRVCLHAGNTKEEVDRLAHAMVEWAREEMQESTFVVKPDGGVQLVQPKL